MIILGRTPKEWRKEIGLKSLYYRTEIIIFIIGFILGAIIFQMNKQLQQQQNLRELARLTFLNLMSANGVMAKTIIRNYKQRQQRESYGRQSNIQINRI